MRSSNRVATRRAPALAALVVTSLIAGVATSSGSTGGERAAQTYRVARIVDGDTLELSSGDRVRLLQIDTPEIGSGECFSRASRRALLRLVPLGSAITLEADALLDHVDRYGRLLRYVRRGGVNVNIRLVWDGAAAPYFYRGERGRYADRLLAAVASARAAKRGLWAACPATALTVTGPIATRVTAPPASTPKLPAAGANAAGGGACDPNYAQGCVPRVPYDLDCVDLRARGLAPVRVVGADVHRFDGDGDGWGCE